MSICKYSDATQKKLCLFAFLSLFLLYVIQSYFGKLNPYSAGLLSTVIVIFPMASMCFLVALLGRVYFVLSLITVWIVVGLLTVTNWWHFQYFGSYFNHEALRFGRDSLEGFRALSAMEYKAESTILLASTLAVTVVIGILYRKAYFHRKAAWSFAAFALLGMTSGLIYFNIFTSNLKQLNVFSLSPSYLHPVHAFFSSVDRDATAEDKKDWQLFKERNKVTDGEVLIDEKLSSIQSTSKKYNIIFLIMESFRASLVGYYSGGNSVTPNFDKIAADYIVAKNFYANTNYTVKSETAFWCGVFDHNARLSIAEYSEPKSIRCMPHILSEQGYKSFYFHGNKGRFYNRTQYLPQVGFDEFYFHGDQPQVGQDGKSYIGWGIADHELLDIMLDRLEDQNRSGQPFFASFMSLSNHYPFSYDWPNQDGGKYESKNNDKTLMENYRDAIRYSDYAIGWFWRRFMQSNLKDNTIVVISSDHGIWVFDKVEKLDEAKRNEIFFRMPFAMYHPEVKSHIEIDQITSQVDVLPTIIDLLSLNVDADRTYIGKNMFYQAQNPWSVMMKGGVVYTRMGQQVCYFDMVCGGRQQSCLTTEVPVAISNAENIKVCKDIKGDLLRGGSVLERNGTLADTIEIDRAFGMIRFENSQLFQKHGLIHNPIPMPAEKTASGVKPIRVVD